MKTKIEIKSIFGKLLFEYESEGNSIAETVKEAIKESADLRDADLRGANLSSADLRDADLSGAYLIGANLSDADLSGAYLNKRYIQVACIGSSKRMTTYCFDDDIVWCGCFRGTLEEFEKQVIDTHSNNQQYLKEYQGFIAYVKSLK